MKLLRRNKRKITIDTNGANEHPLEITETISILILSTTTISKIQEYYIHLFQINHVVNY